MVERVPKSHNYVLTELGAKVAVFFTKLYTRLFRPGLAALVSDQALPSPLAQALTAVSDLIRSTIKEAQSAASATV